MGAGKSPVEAATQAIDTITKKYPTFVGAVVERINKGSLV